jgi:hypothetical protein
MLRMRFHLCFPLLLSSFALCTCVYVCVGTYVCVLMCERACTYVCACLRVRVCTRARACVCVCVCVCMCVCGMCTSSVSITIQSSHLVKSSHFAYVDAYVLFMRVCVRAYVNSECECVC